MKSGSWEPDFYKCKINSQVLSGGPIPMKGFIASALSILFMRVIGTSFFASRKEQKQAYIPCMSRFSSLQSTKKSKPLTCINKLDRALVCLLRFSKQRFLYRKKTMLRDAASENFTQTFVICW